MDYSNPIQTLFIVIEFRHLLQQSNLNFDYSKPIQTLFITIEFRHCFTTTELKFWL